MKKIVSLLVVCLMAAALLAPTVGADDGLIIFQDNFNAAELSEMDWRVEGSLFTIEQKGPNGSPYLDGWAEAVVQQTSYGDEAPAPRIYGPNFAMKSDVFVFSDGGREAPEHKVALWWADHITEYIGTDRIIYTLELRYEQREVALVAHGEGEGMEFFDAQTDVSVWKLPDSEPLEMDTNNPTVVSLGMRVNGTQIDGFYNDQKVVSFTAPRMGLVKCPLLLVNNECHCGFDNFVVSTADYNLFNESASSAGANPAEGGAQGGANAGNNGGAGGATAAPVTSIETKPVVVTDDSGNAVTDASGNAVTEIVTEVVTVPVADTNTSGSYTGGGAQTSDAAIMVVVVMAVALGSAIIVKKIAVK